MCGRVNGEGGQQWTQHARTRKGVLGFSTVCPVSAYDAGMAARAIPLGGERARTEKNVFKQQARTHKPLRVLWAQMHTGTHTHSKSCVYVHKINNTRSRTELRERRAQDSYMNLEKSEQGGNELCSTEFGWDCIVTGGQRKC